MAIEVERHQRRISLEQLGDGAMLVDRKVVHHRIHRERQRRLEFALGGEHDFQQSSLRFGPALRRKDEAHAAARHAAEHPEAPEIISKRGLGSRDDLFGVAVAHPRNDGLQRAKKVFGESCAQAANVAGGQSGEN